MLCAFYRRLYILCDRKISYSDCKIDRPSRKIKITVTLNTRSGIYIFHFIFTFLEFRSLFQSLLVIGHYTWFTGHQYLKTMINICRRTAGNMFFLMYCCWKYLEMEFFWNRGFKLELLVTCVHVGFLVWIFSLIGIIPSSLIYMLYVSLFTSLL